MASWITGNPITCSIDCSDLQHRKHQTCALLVIHRSTMDLPDSHVENVARLITTSWLCFDMRQDRSLRYL